MGTVAAGGLNYVYALSMTILLRPSQYSVFASGQALMLVTGTVANTSVPWLLAREISTASHGSPARGVVWFATVLNLVAGLGAAAVTMGLSAGFADLSTTGWLGAATLAFFMASTGMGWAQGHERFGLLASLIVAEVAIKAGAGLVLVGVGTGPAGAFAAALLGALVIFVGMLPRMWTDLHPSWSVLRSRALWRSAGGMGVIQAGVTFVSVMDILFVSFRFGLTRTAAEYQVAATLMRVPLFIALAFSTAAFPLLARRPGNREVLSAHSTHVLQVIVPLLLLSATLPASVLNAVLPTGYDGAVRFLPFTAAISTAYAIVVVQTTVFRAAGLARTCLLSLVVGGVIAVLSMAVGSTFGIFGLAAGALIGAIAVVVSLAIQTERTWRGAQRPNVRPLLVWPCVGVLLICLRGTPWLWSCLASVVAVQIVRAALAGPDRRVSISSS